MIALHIADGFVSPPVAVVTGVLAALFVGIACWRAKKTLGEKQSAFLGVLGAFVFAAQMLNFPVVGGASGHFGGAAAVAILLGPWNAILVLTSVLVIQCFVFADGGVTALGANVVTMGVSAAFSGWLIYRMFGGASKARLMVGGFAAGWLSIMVAATVCGIELWLSGMAQASAIFPALLGVHALIGIGEGVITAGLLGLVSSARPDLLMKPVPEPTPAEAA